LPLVIEIEAFPVEVPIDVVVAGMMVWKKVLK